MDFEVAFLLCHTRQTGAGRYTALDRQGDAMHAIFTLASFLTTATTFGNPTFVARNAELGLELDNGIAAWGDVNDDGWPDLCNANAIWINREGKHFDRVGTPGTGYIADIDNDGDGDLVCFAPIAIFRNTAASPEAMPTFESVPLPELPETSSRGAAVADFNNDGFLDVYVGGFEVWEPQITYPDLLLLSDKGEKFTLAMNFPDYRARGVTACDFDEDADVDIYVSNYRLMPNVLWVNDGHAGFTNQAVERNALATSEGFGGGHSIGACVADFDNDGHFDIFAGNFAHVDSRGDQPKSRFLRNLGPDEDWKFEDLHECGVWYQESYASPAAADFDNDGDVDLYFTTVYADASFGKKNCPVMYRNDTIRGGAWNFVDVTEGSGLEKLPPTYQAAWADFDGDGDVDLVTSGRLFVNEPSWNAGWLEVRLINDVSGAGGREAVGAQVRVTLDDGRTLSRQVEFGTGEGNSNGPVLHFGLGEARKPLQLSVSWPDGQAQVTSLAGSPGGPTRRIELRRSEWVEVDSPSTPTSP